MTNKTILDIKAGIAFSINAGNVVEEPFPGAYNNNIAFGCWLFTGTHKKKFVICIKKWMEKNNMEFHAAVLYTKRKSFIYQILW